MPRFIIREQADYEVEADDAQTALATFLNAKDMMAYFSGVNERSVLDEKGEYVSVEDPY